MQYSPDCPDDDLVAAEPHWDDLTDTQKLLFGNGVGPEWFPDWLRAAITGYASFYFVSASWKHHDFGYTKGYSAPHRKEYDLKFLAAMKADAEKLGVAKRFTAFILSYTFYSAVRVGGNSSFFFCHRYRSHDEIIARGELDMQHYERILPDGLPGTPPD